MLRGRVSLPPDAPVVKVCVWSPTALTVIVWVWAPALAAVPDTV